MTDLQDAEEILSLVFASGSQRIVESQLSGPLRKYEGRGVVFSPALEDDIDDPENRIRRTVAERTMALVDPTVVLDEALRPHNYTAGARVKNFVRLNHAELPNNVALWFKTSTAVPAEAVLSVAETALSVVVHVEEADPAAAKFLHTLGVHQTRLRELLSLDQKELKRLSATVATTRTLIQGRITPDQLLDVRDAYRDADPKLVIEYAKNAQDRHFEGAVARILEPMFSSLLVLGGRVSGLPLPDGMLFSEFNAALYDCKSVEGDIYELGPADGDQQSRYLNILRRLKNDGFKSEGVIMFVPAAEQREFEAKTAKEPWRQIQDQGFQLIMIDAAALLRLWVLITFEGGAFSAFFDQTAFWESLWKHGLPDRGGITPTDGLNIIGAPKGRMRLVSADFLELFWLCGFTGQAKRKFMTNVGAALADVSPEQNIAERTSRPRFLAEFFKILRDPKPTVADLRAKLGFSDRALRLMLTHRSFEAASAAEWGPNGVKNRTLLREEIEKIPLS